MLVHGGVETLTITDATPGTRVAVHDQEGTPLVTLVADEQGNVKELVTVEIKWEKNDKGQFIPKEQPGTEQTRPAQLVLLAMGFLGPEQALLKELKLETDPHLLRIYRQSFERWRCGCWVRPDVRPRGRACVSAWMMTTGQCAGQRCRR